MKRESKGTLGKKSIKLKKAILEEMRNKKMQDMKSYKSLSIIILNVS